jgi:hypothetical protein
MGKVIGGGIQLRGRMMLIIDLRLSTATPRNFRSCHGIRKNL